MCSMVVSRLCCVIFGAVFLTFEDDDADTKVINYLAHVTGAGTEDLFVCGSEA